MLLTLTRARFLIDIVSCQCHLLDHSVRSYYRLFCNKLTTGTNEAVLQFNIVSIQFAANSSCWLMKHVDMIQQEQKWA